LTVEWEVLPLTEYGEGLVGSSDFLSDKLALLIAVVGNVTRAVFELAFLVAPERASRLIQSTVGDMNDFPLNRGPVFRARRKLVISDCFVSVSVSVFEAAKAMRCTIRIEGTRIAGAAVSTGAFVAKRPYVLSTILVSYECA
jgi:hypothetical protein